MNKKTSKIFHKVAPEVAAQADKLVLEEIERRNKENGDVTAQDVKKVINKIVEHLKNEWGQDEDKASKLTVGKDDGPEAILRKVESKMINDNRRKNIQSLVHELQILYLKYTKRIIAVKNVVITDGGKIIIYDLDTNNDNLQSNNTYQKTMKAIEINGLTKERIVTEDASIMEQLGHVYKAVDKDYTTHKSGYVIWKVSSSKNSKLWAKIKILNRGSLAEIYLHHFYKGKFSKNPADYDKNFRNIKPQGYNMFFYGNRGRISSNSQLEHAVTNQQGFTEEDLDIGEISGYQVYYGSKFGKDYNIYKITNILQALADLYKDINDGPLETAFEKFERNISVGEKSKIYDESGNLLSQKAESHQVIAEVLEQGVDTDKLLEKLSDKQINIIMPI